MASKKRFNGRKVPRGAVTSNSDVQMEEVLGGTKRSAPEFEESPVPDAEQENSSNRKAYNALLTLLKTEDIPKRTAKGGRSGKTAKQRKETEEFDDLEQANNEEWAEEQLTLLEEQNEDEDSQEQKSGEEEIVVDDDNEDDVSDPFEWHFANPDPETLNAYNGVPEFKSKKYPDSSSFGIKSLVQVSSPSLGEPKIKVDGVPSLKLKYRLEAPFKRENGELLSTLQKDLAGPIFSYQDLLFPSRTYDNEPEIQNLYLVHALNHIYKTRDRVLKNNARLAKNPETEYRDQGFTRPKVLILLPSRNSCYELFIRLEKISGLSQTENKKRFKDSFYDPSTVPDSKPLDFQHFFKGNTGDLFCLGIKFTRQAIKLYSSFYSSDLIIASPLGLRLIIGNKGDKKRDFDFLSSIEVMVVDQTDKMQLQSWENLEHIFQHMNLVPKNSHGCDFSRLRTWYVDDKAKLERQTLMFTDYTTPEMNNCLNQYCHNIGGKVKVRPVYTEGSMFRIGLSIRQTYTRISPEDPSNDPDVRFKHFRSVLLPSLMRGASGDGILIFIPSYMDYLRVRNYMDENNYSATWISEYSSVSDLSRSRAYLADGRVKILLYTERLHHYRRFNLKGVRQLVFYGLPDNPTFYKEAMRWLVRSHVELEIPADLLRARVVFSQWDALKLERIVGTSRVGPLLKGSSDTFEFN